MGSAAERTGWAEGLQPLASCLPRTLSFSEEARKAKYQGTVILTVVVGPDGRTHEVRVLRSLGMGLDEKAVEAIHLVEVRARPH